MPEKKRADKEKNDDRRKLYGEAAKRIKAAKRDKYYLEAITLLESLIADRLESYIEKEAKQPEGFRTLEQNIKVAKQYINDSHISESQAILPYLVKIKLWRKLRNEMLHEAVKIEEGKDKDWDSTMNKAKNTVEEGETLFKELRNVVRRVKTQQMLQSKVKSHSG